MPDYSELESHQRCRRLWLFGELFTQVPLHSLKNATCGSSRSKAERAFTQEVQEGLDGVMKSDYECEQEEPDTEDADTAEEECLSVPG